MQDQNFNSIERQDIDFLQSQFSLKWHKFLIYFMLWASALGFIGDAGSYLDGKRLYGDNAVLLYAFYGDLKTLDTIMGVFCIVLAIYAIYVRFQLANFKNGAPNKLLSIYLITLIVPLVYLYIQAKILKTSIDFSSPKIIGRCIATLFYVFVNGVYYSKRKELFVC